MQLINAIPVKYKLTIKQSSSDSENLIIHSHHLIEGSGILLIENLTSKEPYQILISSRTDKIASVTYFEAKVNLNNLHWTKLFKLPRLKT